MANKDWVVIKVEKAGKGITRSYWNDSTYSWVDSPEQGTQYPTREAQSRMKMLQEAGLAAALHYCGDE